jgi:SAM-dependent methyltransferase
VSTGRDVRLSFDGVADVYERARPSYPAVLFDRLFDALPERPDVMEMGPGTGQATALLLERDARVTAVELGPQLAAALAAKFAGHDRLLVVNSSFEDAIVPAGSFDAVVAATAYHWIGPREQIERPVELLRPGGVLAVFDLIQVDSLRDHGYFQAVQPIYDRYESKKRSPWEPTTYDTAEPPVASPLRSSGRYRSVDVYRHVWDQTYSSAKYRDLLWTYSGTQMKPEPERSQMVDELVGVIDRDFGGSITRPLCATLTLAVTNSSNVPGVNQPADADQSVTRCRCRTASR